MSGGFPAGGSAPTDAIGAASPAAGSSGPSLNAPPPGGKIGAGSNVLVIGDSHTIGTFGTQLDKDLRSTGARVETYGSSGSSPSWWINGTTTNSGYSARHADGSVDQPPWNQPHATPKLSDLIAKQRPDTIIVNLGANMRGASAQEIERQVSSLAKMAKESGARLIWVGPPKTREDMSNPSSVNRFNAAMRDAVAPYGTYLSSSEYTRYAGGDGIHYSGNEGSQVARGWADRIFSDIQGQ